MALIPKTTIRDDVLKIMPRLLFVFLLIAVRTGAIRELCIAQRGDDKADCEEHCCATLSRALAVVEVRSSLCSEVRNPVGRGKRDCIYL